jgi:hypothetical protein
VHVDHQKHFDAEKAPALGNSQITARDASIAVQSLGVTENSQGKEIGSASFLKKRSKKLLLPWRLRVALPSPQPVSRSQSFFASFCLQKEVLPSSF